jgi:hypothetical protein
MAIVTSIPPLPFIPQEAHGAPVFVIYAAYSGDPAEGEEVMRPLREFGKPAMDMSTRMPFLALHEIANELFPVGGRYSWHSLYADELSDDLLDRVAVNAGERPPGESAIEVWHLGGAVSDVAPDETAYAHRDAEFLVDVGACWRDPAHDQAHLSWAESSWRDLRESPATREGFYPGFPGFVSGEERSRMAYGDNLARLAALKAEYDPENLLRSNLNVEPAR